MCCAVPSAPRPRAGPASRVGCVQRPASPFRWLPTCARLLVSVPLHRYLLVDNCADVKLVLEAFQLSAAQAVAYPRAPGLLRCLMAGRLATAQLSPALQVHTPRRRRGCGGL